MSIVELQRRLAEAGRIRIGEQLPTQGGKTRPAKLAAFRLTSRDRTKLDAAASLYGGTVKEWAAPAGSQWELYTTADSMSVVVPPSDMSFSQWYELWSAGGCQRRCDGERDLISEYACLCDPDPERRECKMTTRLSVLLPDITGLGLWRIESHGYNAAVELAGAFSLLQMLGTALVPATLRLEQRSVIRDGKTRRFAVPVLDVAVSARQLVGMSGGEGASVPQIEAGTGGDVPYTLESATGSPITPVPAPALPALSVAEQIAALDDPPPVSARSNAAAPIPPTGVSVGAVRPSDGDSSDEDEVDADAGPIPIEDAWSQLATLLGERPDTSMLKKVVEAQTRRLFRLMVRVGLWRDGQNQDAIHLAVGKHGGHEHVSDLRKAELVSFAETAWDAAAAKWGETDRDQ